MIKTVYVAGPSAHLEKMQGVFDAVRRGGLEIVHDWVAEIKARGEANPKLGGQGWAKADIAGVMAADVFFYVHVCCGAPLSPGAMAELGAAFAAKKPIYVFADPEDRKKSIFLDLATESFYGYEVETVARRLLRMGRLEEKYPAKSDEELGRLIHAMRGQNDTAFVKNDSSKSRVDLLDPAFVLDVGYVLGHGASKYEPHNWRRCEDSGRYTGAALRHLLAIMAGDVRDPDSGLAHAAHLGANAMFLHWFGKR